MGVMKRIIEAGGKYKETYVLKTPVIETDARGALGLLKRLSYDEILKRKDLKKYVRQSLNQARKEMRAITRKALPRDPRKSYMGIKVLIYKDKEVLGGNISLFNQKSAGKKSTYVPVRGGRSGILRNRPRSRDTIRRDSYYGRDRAFLLRMHNQGTKPRLAFTRIKSKNGKTANRGSLRALNFFDAADGAVKRAAETLSQKLESAIIEAGYGK
uniref:hypothetical protein n=1 Tax=Bacteroides ovatus TaxID=28116 RepID=UPI00359C3733